MTTQRPFTLPARASRTDCEAYVYLCARPDVWRAWCRAMATYPLAGATDAAALVRLRGTPINSAHAAAIGRIYRATRGERSAVAA